MWHSTFWKCLKVCLSLMLYVSGGLSGTNDFFLVQRYTAHSVFRWAEIRSFSDKDC